MLTILCVSLLLTLPLTSQESPEFKEASDLTQAFLKLVNEQKYDQALPLAKRALEIDKDRFTPTELSGKPVPVYGVIQYKFVYR